MRFIIKESVSLTEDSSAPRDWQKEFNEADTEAKNEIVKQWLHTVKPISANLQSKIDSWDKGGQALFGSIVHSINLRTFAVSQNPFLSLLKNFRYSLDDAGCSNMASLPSIAYGSNKIDLTQKWFQQSSLYDRTADDFVYTVKFLDIVNDPSKLAKYYKSVDGIQFNDVYGSSGIKPAGLKYKRIKYDKDQVTPLPAKEQPTLWGMSEVWGMDGNDKPADKKVNDTKSTQSQKAKVYKSTEEADKAHQNVKGNSIVVQKKYTYDGKEWVEDK